MYYFFEYNVMFGVYIVVFFPTYIRVKYNWLAFLSVIKSYLASSDLISFWTWPIYLTMFELASNSWQIKKITKLNTKVNSTFSNLDPNI